MYILGIETTTPIMSIALSQDEKLLEEVSENCENSQVVKIIPKIDYILKKNKLSLDQIDLIGVDIGPGIFTGTRIGLTVVKTFSQVNSIDIVGITSLHALAYQAMKLIYQLKNENIQNEELCIFPLIDAKREEVYCSSFTCRNSLLNKICEAELIKIDELEQKVFKLIGMYKKIVLCGNILIDYPFINSKFEKEEKVTIFGNVIVPKANAINFLAFQKYNKGVVDNYTKLNPIYVRKFKPFGK